MTEEQLEVARDSMDFHRQSFKFKTGNANFLSGYIERLDEISELEEGTFDIIVSNCVINLSPDKNAVLKQAYKLLKPGNFFSSLVPSSLII